jgi:hypothetical protein
VIRERTRYRRGGLRRPRRRNICRMKRRGALMNSALKLRRREADGDAPTASRAFAAEHFRRLRIKVSNFMFLFLGMASYPFLVLSVTETHHWTLVSQN